jgi:hypothetical protein
MGDLRPGWATGFWIHRNAIQEQCADPLRDGSHLEDETIDHYDID